MGVKIKQNKRFPINQWIQSQNLRVIGSDGEQIGVLSKFEALKKAEEAGLDLVEISPNTDPPVAKIIDFGKFKYDQQKIDKKNKKKQKAGETKEIRFGLKISAHDLEVKAKKAEKFLLDKNKVSIMLKFKGREITHKELGIKVLERVVERLDELAKPETEIKSQGMSISVTLAPR